MLYEVLSNIVIFSYEFKKFCVLYIHNVCRTQKIYFVILICCSEITFSMRIYLANSIENYNSNTIYCSLYFPPTKGHLSKYFKDIIYFFSCCLSFIEDRLHENKLLYVLTTCMSENKFCISL